MGKYSYCFFILVLCICICFAGCAKDAPATTAAAPATTQIPTQPQLPATSVPTATTVPAVTTVPPTVAPPSTAPVHSELYIPGLETEDVIRYFNEICLDAEFVNSGNPNLLQKWNAPITYWINGNTTAEDLSQFQGMVDWLNTLEGFPGMQQADAAWQANMTICFCTEQEMLDLLGDQFYGTDGGVTFWYDGENRIYDAIICYRTDLSQHVRNSVILEEIYNALGPVQDTQLRPDSIIYAGYSEPQALTQIDELLLKLLYHPRMHCGMNQAECEAVIRQLYD